MNTKLTNKNLKEMQLIKDMIFNGYNPTNKDIKYLEITEDKMKWIVNKHLEFLHMFRN